MKFDDPLYYPTDYDGAADVFLFQDATADVLGESSFLDQRAPLRWNDLSPVAPRDVPTLPTRAPAFVFHTAFCGSTLLARALHAPPRVVALKEPKALLGLSQRSLDLRAEETAAFDERLGLALDLLGRPWRADGAVLIKPTNQVNRLLPAILRLRPDTRAVLLYSSLEEFLLSCCKKLPEAETRIRWMAQHLLIGGALAPALGVSPRHAFDFVESCVLTWYAQIERYAQALAADTDDRLRTLDMRVLMRAPEATVRACATHLRLDGALEQLPERVRANFARDAKHTDKSYSPEQREREKAALQARYAPLVQAALAWANQAIAPVALAPKDWKPLAV